MYSRRGHVIGALAATLAVIAFVLPLRPPCFCRPRVPAQTAEAALPGAPSCCCHHSEPVSCPVDSSADHEGDGSCTGCCNHAEGCPNCASPCCLGKPTMPWSGTGYGRLIILSNSGMAISEDLALPASCSIEDVFHPPKV